MSAGLAAAIRGLGAAAVLGVSAGLAANVESAPMSEGRVR